MPSVLTLKRSRFPDVDADIRRESLDARIAGARDIPLCCGVPREGIFADDRIRPRSTSPERRDIGKESYEARQREDNDGQANQSPQTPA